MSQSLLTPNSTPRLLMTLEALYKELCTLQDYTEEVLSNALYIPEVMSAYNKLLETDRLVREMFIGQADKIIAVNIGGEDTKIVDLLDDKDSVHFALRRAQAKRFAKRLYSLHHPDKGGSPASFNTIRRAVEHGDLEVLMYFRIRDGIDDFAEDDIKQLTQKIQVRIQQFKGSNGFQIARTYHSNREESIKRYIALMEKRTETLNMQMFGMTVNKHQPQKETAST